jgi:geranylgeranyl reductase family protein
MWDVVIVGAGPAGSAAALGALTARPDLKVLLLDRAAFPRDKSCGDGVAPHVLDVLAEVGVTGLLDDRVPVARMRLRRADREVARTMVRPAWVVPRTVLDARLVAAAVEAGATLQQRRVRSVRIDTGAAVIDEELPAEVVVGADGAHSLVRAAAGLAPAARRALAIRGYAPTRADRRGQQVIVFGKRRQPSYAWSFDRGDGLANVGYGELLSRRGSAPTRTQLLSHLEELLPGSAADGSDWLGHHLPLSSWRWQQPDGRLLLAGDAAGLINPMTGEGIYYAVATGVAAGRAAAEALTAGASQGAGARHRRSVRSRLARHLRHTATASRLVSAPAVVSAGIRAAARDQQVFDDLVEVGLGQGLLTRRVLRGLLPLAGADA